MDTSLWAHRIILSSVSPFLQKLLVHYEKQGDDVTTIHLPMIKGYHMQLVLDYIYGGAMYLCGAHMQFVIQVMEVLQLKCGVSVNKMVKATEESQDPAKQWIEIEHSTMHIKEYDSDHCKSEDESDEKIIGKAIHSNQQREEMEESNVPEIAPEEKRPEQPESTEVPNNVQSLNKERRLSSRDEDSEDDNDVVMVELDEDSEDDNDVVMVEL